MEQKLIVTDRKYIIYKKGNNTIIFTSRQDRHKGESLIQNPNYKENIH